MKLNQTQIQQLQDNAVHQQKRARLGLPLADLKPVVRLHASDEVWLLTELNPVDGDTVKGLNIIPECYVEFETFSLKELENHEDFIGQPIQNDLKFRTNQTLREHYQEELYFQTCDIPAEYNADL